MEVRLESVYLQIHVNVPVVGRIYGVIVVLHYAVRRYYLPSSAGKLPRLLHVGAETVPLVVFGVDLELRYVVGVAVMLGYTLPHSDGVFLYLFHLCLSLTVFVCFLGNGAAGC